MRQACAIEAAEPHNPLNDGLDAFDSFVRMLKEYGCEAQLRARFDALIPPIAPPAPVIGAGPDEPIDMLEDRMLLDALKRCAKLNMPDGAHNARRRVLSEIESRLDRALKARRAA